MTSGRQGPDVGRAPEWHNAQVIEATTPKGNRYLLSSSPGLRDFYTPAGTRFTRDQLSDVRIVVDRDGNVAPPEVTDEMVTVAAWEIHKACGCDGVCEPHPEDWTGARAALEAVLKGGDHA